MAQHGLKMRQTFVLGTNFSLHLVSFLFFLIYFGVPSIEKYLEKKTIIVTSEEQTKGIRAPAVTFFAAKNSIFGWKTLDESILEDVMTFDLFDHCNSINISDIETCVSTDTFNLTDFLKTARLGWTDQTTTKDFLDESSSSFWTKDFTSHYLGTLFTLHYRLKLIKSVH